jgi:hypothetical protein
MRAIDRFERFGTPLHNGQDYLKNHIFERYPIVYSMDQVADCNSEYAWVVDPEIKVYDSFPWYFRPVDSQPAIHAFPYVYKKSRKIKCWNKIQLVPVAPGDYETKQHSYICGEYDVYKSKERFDIFYIGEDKQQINRLAEKFGIIQVVDNIKTAQQNSFTDMFWVVYDDTILRDTFKFSYVPDEWSFDFVHVFGNGDIDRLDGIALVPKHYELSQREIDYRFFANKKEIRIMASNPRQYDRFEINSYEQYLDALKNSQTDMFWGYPQDIVIEDYTVFDFTIAHGSKDRESNHAWLNGNKYDGVVLYSKKAFASKKEIDYRFLVDKIEHPTCVSYPCKFERFVIDTYEDYVQALSNSTTQMFWGIPSDVEEKLDFGWDNYFDDKETIDRTTTHVFKNGEHYDGIVLFSTTSPVTEKEVEHRFYINKKEHDVVASTPVQYDIFSINNYEDYTEALYNTKTQMFWGVPDDIEVDPNFKFDMYFSHHNNFDRNINHVFLNDTHRDGIVLFSKNVLVSEKEVEHRFYIKKKEWDVVASVPKNYPIYTIETYQDYLDAKERSEIEMFWLTYPDIDVSKDFKYDFYISHHNQYERKINHVWRNGEYYDGLALTNKNITLTQREIDYRFFAVKKEYDVIASVPKPYNIVFISNGESNADENYNLLLQRYPHAKRIDRVKGIHQAHIAAAQLAETEMFWVVDGDAQILDDFDFDYQIAHYDIDGRQTVHVWRSFNPVNNLVYGYGGVKLLPTELTRNVDVNSTDMTTSISKHFKGIDVMSNTTAFNTDAFSAWRSGFRECVKLASRVIDRQKDDETEFRLNAWCTRGADKPFGEYAIAGSILGREYGERNRNNLRALKMINDFNWLQEQFSLSSYPQDE